MIGLELQTGKMLQVIGVLFFPDEVLSVPTLIVMFNDLLEGELCKSSTCPTLTNGI